MSSPPKNRLKWKGKFVSSKQYNLRKKASEVGSQNINRRVQKQNDPPAEGKDEVRVEVPVQGYRFIDINHMAKSMYCNNCEQPLLLQNIIKETVEGAGSVFNVLCKKCTTANKVLSGKQYKNPVTGKPVFEASTKYTLGALHAGIGPTQLNKFLSTTDAPEFNPQVFKQHERIIGPIIELVAKESCSEATIMERLLTLESLDELKSLLPDDLQEGFLVVNMESRENDQNIQEKIVRIFASYDMGWSQRGNGYAYDSLNGYCAIIGLKTGKVLDFCTRNRKCRLCEAGRLSGKSNEHDCRLNFFGSAKAMESDGAVQLVTKSNILTDNNVEVGVFIGDNDNCSLSAIQKTTGHRIIKHSDMNHTTKGVGNMLHDIHNNKQLDPDRELSNDTIKHLQRCFTYAIKQNKGNIPKIRAAIKNIPFHVFDLHENCTEWCHNSSEKENSVGIRLKNQTLFNELKSTFLKLSDNVEKFAAAASSQPNESLNNSMCSKTPKRLSYSCSESADFRFACTVAEKNLGTEYRRQVFNHLNISHGRILDKSISTTTQLKLKKKTMARKQSSKKRRLQLKAKRTQLRNRREDAEGVTYRTNVGLLAAENTIASVYEPVTKLPETEIYFQPSTDFAIVFFDIETGGLGLSCGILQIAAKCEDMQFNCFITPTRSIDASATKVTGLSKVQKQLFQHGKEVQTLPSRIAFEKFFEFLKTYKKQCILVAHNCSFDSTRIIRSIKSLSMLEQWQGIIFGFSDTLSLFKKKFSDRKSDFKLTSLAADFLSVSPEGAHDALFDVQLLERLSALSLDANDIIQSCTSVEQVLRSIEKSALSREHLPSFSPMGQVISSAMKKRLSEFDISYESMVRVFKNHGIEKTKEMLRGEANGKAQIIKSEKIMNIILEYLHSLP